ncbi:MAG: hypothetical protein V4598_02460 [Bdellovibrionota bacterium]
MLNLALIIGLWTTTCIQTQNPSHAGFVIESYEVRENGNYDFKRDWYADPMCSQQYDTETETGSVKVGKKLSGIFVTANTFEADFETVQGVDLGAVKVESNKLKVARGMRGSTMRNTMVGLFEYVKK